jgi:hypothetical protein
MHTFYLKDEDNEYMSESPLYTVVGIKTTRLPSDIKLGSKADLNTIRCVVSNGHTVVVYPKKRLTEQHPDLPRELHLTPEYEAKLKAKKAPQTPATPPELEPFFQFLESTPRKWRQVDNVIVRKNGDSAFYVYITEFPKTTNKLELAVLTATWKYEDRAEYNPAIRTRLLQACGLQGCA